MGMESNEKRGTQTLESSLITFITLFGIWALIKGSHSLLRVAGNELQVCRFCKAHLPPRVT